jgi:uncharacterized HAD superfamily protein
MVGFIMKKKKLDILIDIDGTIANTIALVLELYNKRFGTSLKEKHIREYKQRIGETNIHEEAKRTLSVYENVLNIQPYKLAIEICKILMKRHTVRYITAREPDTKDATCEWLINHLGIYPELIMEHDKYKVDADILIDDHLETIKKYVECKERDKPRAGPRMAIIIERFWNSDNRFDITYYLMQELVIPARNWAEIYSILLRMSNSARAYPYF